MSTPQNAETTAQLHSIRSIDDDVLAVLELQEQIENLQGQLVVAKGRIADRGPGKYTTAAGIVASVTEPPRSFDLEKAWSLLTDEQRAVCQSPDGKKIREQLPPVLAEQCMAAGSGKPRVTIR